MIDYWLAPGPGSSRGPASLAAHLHHSFATCGTYGHAMRTPTWVSGMEKLGRSSTATVKKLTLTEFTNLAYSSAEGEVRQFRSELAQCSGVSVLLACAHERDHVLFGLDS